MSNHSVLAQGDITNSIVNTGTLIIVPDAPREQIPSEELRQSVQACGALLRAHKHTIGLTGRSIPRTVVSEIVGWAKSSEAKLVATGRLRGNARVGVLLDGAGMGKTSVSREVMLALEAEGFCVLAIKSDQQLAGVQTPESLSAFLGLPLPLDTIVRQLSIEGPVAIIVDQIDALSLALSRDQRAMDIILATVAHFKEIPNVRVLVSCRTFDLHSDPRLRHLANCRSFSLALFNDEEVRPFIEEQGFEWNRFSTGTRDLLRVPLHLDLFVSALEKSAPGVRPTIADFGYGLTTLQDLYRLVWQSVVRRAEAGAPSIAEREMALERLAQRMVQSQKTSAPQALFSRPENAHLESAVQWLASTGVLIAAGNEWAFLHQTFLDYCAAKTFVESGKDLCETILGGDQALFARSQMLQSIAYLRGSDRSIYLTQLQKLFASPSLRHHLRTLLREWFGSLRDPDDAEWRLAQRLLQSSPEREQLLSWMGHNPGWFARLRSTLLPRWLQKEDEFLDDAVRSYLCSMNDLAQDEIAVLLLPFVGKSDSWNGRILNWLSSVAHWQSAQAVLLFEKTLAASIAAPLAEGKKWHFGHISSLDKLVEFDPRAGCRILRLLLDGLLALFRAHREESKYPDAKFEDALWGRYSLSDRLEVLNGSSAHDLFETLSTNASETFLEEMVPWLEDALGVLESEETPYHLYHFRNDELYEIWYGSGHCVRQFVMEGIASALAHLATTNKPHFERLVARLSAIPTHTPHQILVHAFQMIPDPLIPGLLADDAALYLLGDQRRLILGDRGNYDSRHLIAHIAPHLSAARRDELQDFIVACSFDAQRWKGQNKHLLKYRGHDELLLFEAFPVADLNSNARQIARELRRKFPDSEADDSPLRFRMSRDRTALPLEKALKISDKAWLKIFRRSWETPLDALEARDQHLRRSDLSGALINSIIAQPKRFWLLFNRLRENGLCESLCLLHRNAFIEGFAGATRPLEEHYILAQDDDEEDDDEGRDSAKPLIVDKSLASQELFSPIVAPLEWFFEVVRALAPVPGLQGSEPDNTILSWADMRRHLAWHLEKHAASLPLDLIDLLESYVRTVPFGTVAAEGSYEKERERLAASSAHDAGNALLNHERGAAWSALMRTWNLQKPLGHEARRWAVLESAASDPSPILRLAVIDQLKFHVQDHRERSMALFEKCVADFPEVLRAGDTREFLYWALGGQFRSVVTYLEVMMAHVGDVEKPTSTDLKDSKPVLHEAVIGEDALRELHIKWKIERKDTISVHDQECAQNGAELVCIAALSSKILEDDEARESSKVLALSCVKGPLPWRLGAAHIGTWNLNGSQAEVCLQWLRELLDDENEKVRDKVGHFFGRASRGLVNLPDEIIISFATDFATSRALMDGLDEWRDYLWMLCETQPEVMLTLLETSLANSHRFQSHFYHTQDWMRLALRVYTDPLCDSTWRARALDVFDQLMSQNSGVAQQLLNEWDRR